MKLIAVIFDEDEESTEQDMAKQFTFRERDKVNRRARKALGLKVRDAQDKADFMEQCIPQMMTDGEAGDASEAEIICELLWEEGESDLYD